ncbi:hypothetical protein PYCC9005_004335 [Savitreella phatthalungensis]
MEERIQQQTSPKESNHQATSQNVLSSISLPNTAQETQQLGSRVLLAGASAAFGIGLLWALRRTRKERRDPAMTFFEPSVTPPRYKARAGQLDAPVDDGFSPVVHGFKALAVATLLCGSIASAAVLATTYALDVHDLPSFTTRMRSLIGTALPSLRKSLSSSQSANQKIQDEVEWQEIWDEGKRVDAERAEVKRLRKLKQSKADDGELKPI